MPTVILILTEHVFVRNMTDEYRTLLFVYASKQSLSLLFFFYEITMMCQTTAKTKRGKTTKLLCHKYIRICSHPPECALANVCLFSIGGKEPNRGIQMCALSIESKSETKPSHVNKKGEMLGFLHFADVYVSNRVVRSVFLGVTETKRCVYICTTACLSLRWISVCTYFTHAYTQVPAHVCVCTENSKSNRTKVCVCVCVFCYLNLFFRSMSTCIELLQIRGRTFRFSLSLGVPSLSCNATSISKTKSIHIGVVRLCVCICVHVNVYVFYVKAHTYSFPYGFFSLSILYTPSRETKKRKKMKKKHSVIGRCYSLTCCCYFSVLSMSWII